MARATARRPLRRGRRVCRVCACAEKSRLEMRRRRAHGRRTVIYSLQLALTARRKTLSWSRQTCACKSNARNHVQVNKVLLRNAKKTTTTTKSWRVNKLRRDETNKIRRRSPAVVHKTHTHTNPKMAPLVLTARESKKSSRKEWRKRRVFQEVIEHSLLPNRVSCEEDNSTASNNQQQQQNRTLFAASQEMLRESGILRRVGVENPQENVCCAEQANWHRRDADELSSIRRNKSNWQSCSRNLRQPQRRRPLFSCYLLSGGGSGGGLQGAKSVWPTILSLLVLVLAECASKTSATKLADIYWNSSNPM